MIQPRRTGNGKNFYLIVNKETGKVREEFRSVRVAREYMKEYELGDEYEIKLIEDVSLEKGNKHLNT